MYKRQFILWFTENVILGFRTMFVPPYSAVVKELSKPFLCANSQVVPAIGANIEVGLEVPLECRSFTTGTLYEESFGLDGLDLAVRLNGRNISVLLAAEPGHADLQMPLRFVRVEPYVIPKRSLTGDSLERVDTRVLQVIYEFDRPAFPIYVGQQVDVFIRRGTTNAPADSPAPIATAR